jgi:hypothetical protein
MDKERLKELAEDPRFVSGIYNYCDRWCERCVLASRCLNFAMQEEEALSPEARDPDNKAFWERLQETFRVTLELIRETAEEQGIDLDSVDTEDTAAEERQRREEAESDVCCAAAKRYADDVKRWFESSGDLFEHKGRELEQEVLLGLPGSDPEKAALDLKDAVEVIHWYQYQIFVKLMRAVTGEMRGRPEIIEDYPKDSDGSAKVALLGMDRSIGAWGEMRRHFPDREGEITDMLVQLTRLRKRTEETFPDARAFVRPGFDELPEPPP